MKAIAELLEEKSAIPMVREQLAFIQEVQSDDWWRDVTPGMLEQARRRLRDLVKLIEKAVRKPIYTDFTDVLGRESAVDLPGFVAPDGFERFKAKTHQFLLRHENHLAIQKLRLNEPLTAADLAEMERMLLESGVGTKEQLELAKTQSQGLGLFVRSLVGLEREAAKRAFAGFLSGKTLNSSQIEFVNLIIEQLTQHGAMEAKLLYESPFTDIAARGRDGIFTPAQVDQLILTLASIRMRAIA